MAEKDSASCRPAAMLSLPRLPAVTISNAMSSLTMPPRTAELMLRPWLEISPGGGATDDLIGADPFANPLDQLFHTGQGCAKEPARMGDLFQLPLQLLAHLASDRAVECFIGSDSRGSKHAFFPLASG